MTDRGRALLFLDVDGPLIPFGIQPEQCATASSARSPAMVAPDEAASNPLLARLNPEHGRRLVALRCELIWATSWMSDANDVISPYLGLPSLPIVTWPDQDDAEPAGLHWKTQTLLDWAAGRTFIWVDDEITNRDRTWVEANYPGPALLHQVDARIGLTDANFTVLDRWLAGLKP